MDKGFILTHRIAKEIYFPPPAWSRNCFQNSENATVIERVVC